MTLEDIFGESSTGEDAESRAASSSRIFVRSHMQLALDTEQATGRRLTAQEALHSYGLKVLGQVATEGGVALITDVREPSQTFFERRRTLRLSKRELALAAKIGIDEVTAAETAGEVLPFRTLEKIAQALALDERKIGLSDTPHGDREFGTRLRELRGADDRDESFVAALADAAWVIARQRELSRTLNADNDISARFGVKSGNYAAPVWERGYELAQRTRQILKFDACGPIESMYSLAHDVLGIPVVNTDLSPEVAGATVLNGSSRGIVLNQLGANANILVRRMTIAHELGHLLWDPDNRLERVRVDESATLNRRDIRDEVEARANAFAVAFLAPKQAVRTLHEKIGDVAMTIASMVEQFGISRSAASHHLANVCNLDSREVTGARSVGIGVTRIWEEKERQDSLFTDHVPTSRGGRFALLTAQAVRKKVITVDTAASWLKIDKRYLAELF